MKPLATVLLVLAACARAAAADKPAADDPPLPKEVWEKKLAAEIAVLRFETEATAKQLRDSRDKVLLLAQRLQKGDHPEAAKPLREALKAWEERGLDRLVTGLGRFFADSKGTLDDLNTAAKKNAELRAALRTVSEALTTDPRAEAAREKVLKLERGGDAKELAKARRELFEVTAPAFRARLHQTLAAQLEVSRDTNVLAEAVARLPDEAKKVSFLRRAQVLAEQQADVGREFDLFVRWCKEHGESVEAAEPARKAVDEARKHLAAGKVGDECLKAQAEVVGAIVRTIAAFKVPDKPGAAATLTAEEREEFQKLVATFEALAKRSERQSAAVRQLQEDAVKRLLAELEEPEAPKKP